MVLSANDVGDIHQVIIHDDGEIVGGKAVGLHHHDTAFAAHGERQLTPFQR